jgi:hypothetical protein
MPIGLACQLLILLAWHWRKGLTGLPTETQARS